MLERVPGERSVIMPGKIIRLKEKPTDYDLKKWFPDKYGHFWERPDTIAIGSSGLVSAKIGLPNQYGRIFNSERELRWEADHFWLAEDDPGGDYETRPATILLRHDNGPDEYKVIKAVHYLKSGMVVYTRFKEVVK